MDFHVLTIVPLQDERVSTLVDFEEIQTSSAAGGTKEGTAPAPETDKAQVIFEYLHIVVVVIQTSHSPVEWFSIFIPDVLLQDDRVSQLEDPQDSHTSPVAGSSSSGGLSAHVIIKYVPFVEPMRQRSRVVEGWFAV